MALAHGSCNRLLKRLMSPALAIVGHRKLRSKSRGVCALALCPRLSKVEPPDIVL
jgi:hypothetical protein